MPKKERYLPQSIENERQSDSGKVMGDMNGLSWSCNWPKLLRDQDLAVSKKGKNILRELAKRVAEIAAHPRQEEKEEAMAQT